MGAILVYNMLQTHGIRGGRMRSLVRLAGLTLCVIVLLTTCGAPFSRGAPRISSFVAPPAPALAPTVQATVTPAFSEQLARIGAGQPGVPPTTAALSAILAPAPSQRVGADLIAKAAQMDAYLNGLAQQGAFSGAVLVALPNQVVISRGYGMANAEQGLPASATTRFRLASVSKSLTALGVMRLVAAGKLDLQASICAYLQPCPPAWGPVTVANLLNHTSGIANYTDFAEFVNVEQQPASVDQVIARFRDLPLGFEPGTLYQYCNSNFVLLGALIERVAGQSYPDFMRDQIFAPLNMNDTGYDPGDFGPLNGTRGYSGGALDIPLNTSNLFAAGGLYSTVADLYKLSQALDNGTLLPADLAAQMFTPGLGSYGYGWKIEQRFGRPLIYHPGSMSGAATWFGRFPGDGLTIVVLSNDYYANTYAIADYLAGLVLQ